MSTGKEYMTETEAFNARILRVEDQISEVAASLGSVIAEQRATNANVNSLVVSMREQGELIRQVAARQNERTPTNWGWLISAVLLLGIIIALYTNPIDRKVDLVHKEGQEARAELMRVAVETARQAESLRWLEKDHDRKAGP